MSKADQVMRPDRGQSAHQCEVTFRARKHEEGQTGNWKGRITVGSGDLVDYLLSYRNTDISTRTDVIAGVALPAGVTYIAGTTRIYNGSHPVPEGLVATDDLTTGVGINLGNYTPGSDALVRLAARVDEDVSISTHGPRTCRSFGMINTDHRNYEAFAALAVITVTIVAETDIHASIAACDDTIARLAAEPATGAELASVLIAKAGWLSRLERQVEAAAVYDELIARYAGDRARDVQTRVTGAMINKAHALSRAGRYEDALRACNAARDRLGSPCEWSARCRLADLEDEGGYTLSMLGRWDEALERRALAVGIRTAVLGESHESTAISRSNLALVFTHLPVDRRDAALAPLRDRASEHERHYGLTDERTIEALEILANTTCRLGLYEDALKHRHRTVHALDQAEHVPRSRMLTAKARLAVAYARLGQLDTALDLVQEVEDCRAMLPGGAYLTPALAIADLTKALHDGNGSEVAEQIVTLYEAGSGVDFVDHHDLAAAALGDVADAAGRLFS